MKTQTNLVRPLILAAVILLLLLVSHISFAQTMLRVKNIVIVHGAFVDGSGWEAVYEILKKDGYNVTLVQNHLTSLEEDVAATNRALDKLDSPCILVGHSWGGVVITQVGNSPKVAGLVYVAAFVPAMGESVVTLLQSAPPLPVNGILPADDKGLIYFDKLKFRDCFAADLSVAKTNFMADSQQPITLKSFLTPVTHVAWKTKPSYAIVATEDKSINPELERTMYKRSGSTVTEIKGSHAIYISQPMKVVTIIETAAGGMK